MKVLLWRYSDHSAFGVLRVYEDDKRALKDFELVDQTGSKDYELVDVELIKAAD